MKEDIKFFPRENINYPISMQMTGVSYCDGSYHIIRPSSHITVIEYICSGEGGILIKNKNIPIRAGDVYILPKGIDHEYYSSSKNPMTKIFMNIYGDLAVTLLSNFSLKDKFVYAGRNVEYLFMKAKRLMFDNMDDDLINLEMCGIYFEILSKLHISRLSENTNSEANRLKKYIDSNFSRIIGNKELASQIYRSVDYCIKVFKLEYGTTPYDYQIEHKIDFAKSLLRDTPLPISEVSMTIGYDDAQYFSNLFKQKCGISPREYRKSQKQL